MTKVDLITGFLGAGKTTFIRKYVEYLIRKGEKVCILENDYGAVNVDTMLLSDLEGDRVGIEMVAGGCDHDCHIRRFKTKMISMAMMGYDRVLVEPSGVFDVDEFFDVLREDPLERLYTISAVIALVDASVEGAFSTEADHLLASQVAMAGKVLLTHADEVEEEQIPTVVERLNQSLAAIKCDRSLRMDKNLAVSDLVLSGLEPLSDEIFESLAAAGYVQSSFVKKYSMDENPFASMFFMNPLLTKEEILKRIPGLFGDLSLGNVMRVKGFLKDGDSTWWEVNATKRGITVKEIPVGQEILIVIGEKLDEERIVSIFPAKYSTNKEGQIYGD